MPYTIHKSDGTDIPIADDTINQTWYNPGGGGGSKGLGIQLIGRNTLNYGAPIAQSFLQMNENFASPTGTQPVGGWSLQGQLWYDKSLKILYVRITDGTGTSDTGTFAQNWRQVVTVAPGGATSIPIVNPSTGTEKDGDIRVVGTVISIWAGGNWRQVYPALPGPAVYS
ncbi:MAG: hypothetical protein ACHQ1D_01745 [Nitrososphaerales archaeon]